MQQAAVIILNYNGVHFLEKFLPSVTQYSTGHRVIVADNASTDSSLAFLSEHYPEVEIIVLPQNYGFAKGYDEALKHINNPYSILLNSDVEVTPHWIEPILELMESNAQIAACQPKIRAYHRKDYFEHAGAAGGFVDMLGYPFCRGRILDQVERDEGQYDDMIPIFWATGACFFVRTEVYRALGGFDAIFHAHMEEIDLCWRIHAAGYQIYYYPDSVVYHVGGGTMPASNPRKTYLNFRNSTGVLFKNAPFPQVLWKVPLKIGLDLLAAGWFYAQGQHQNGSAVIKAIADFLRYLGEWRKRRQAVTVKGFSDQNIIMPRLLVVNRYLRGRKKFSQLRF